VAYKLLLADDSITIQKVVELILAEEDFEIRTAGNGEEALSLIQSFGPDIVLADIEMPKMNGYQLCEKIKQNPSTGNIPVILLTGAFEPVDEELAKQVGADDFIIKPFESQELISKLNAVLTISSVPDAEISEEGAVEAEAVLFEETPEEVPEENISIEEDLWSMEEIPEPVEVKEWQEEEAAPGTEEFIALDEEAPVEAELPVSRFTEEPKDAEKKTAMPEVALPSTEEFRKLFQDIVREKTASLLSSLDIKDAVLASLMPLMRDAVEKILWEVAPDLVERMLKEMLKGTLESLTKEVEKVIWETVPDLAETMISKEIERIRSEF
jgi:CheY-like chemotaxis protein